MGFHNHFVPECKKYTCLIAFSKDQFWNTCMMRVTLITDNDVALWKVCYNSQSQDVLNFHARIVTSYYTLQNEEWWNASVDTNNGLQWVYSINYLQRKWIMRRKMCILKFFDVPDSTVISCKLEYATNGRTPLKDITLENRKHYLKLLATEWLPE